MSAIERQDKTPAPKDDTGASFLRIVADPGPEGAKPRVHPQAVVEPGAKLGDDVEIGPFCVVGSDVEIGAGTKLVSPVTVLGITRLGAGNLIFPNAVLGAPPQDKKFRGEQTRLEIGDQNQIREAVTIHTGTDKGGGVTRIGSNNLLMVNCHIGHDARIADHCVLSNNVMIAGHCHIGSGVVLSGGVGIHHFVTVDDYAYAGGYARLTHDVPPFVKVDENAKIRGLNAVGLRRAGFSDVDIDALEEAIFRLFLDRDRKPLSKVIAGIESGEHNGLYDSAQVRRVLDFLKRRDQGKHGRYLESLRQS